MCKKTNDNNEENNHKMITRSKRKISIIEIEEINKINKKAKIKIKNNNKFYKLGPNYTESILKDNIIDNDNLNNETNEMKKNAIILLENLINTGIKHSNTNEKGAINSCKVDNIIEKYNDDSYDYFYKQSFKTQKKILKIEKKILKINNNIPVRFKILNSNLNIQIKSLLIKKLEQLDKLDTNNNEYHKLYNYVDGLVQIPFGIYNELPIKYNKVNHNIKEIQDYILNCSNILNKAVHGHDKAKFQILQIVSKWIANPISNGNVFSIIGPMGNGKTTLVKEGISKMINRPFFFISLGGATDSSFLDGHSYTYEGSIPGKIVEILKKSSCMNPVIYFDELDKVSDTPRGQEIINLLIHLTDFSQNDTFTDKYYSDIPFDLSKCLFIFSLNDLNKINPILKDRMETIKTDKLTIVDKIIISKNYLIPNILKNINFNKELIFKDNIIEHIIMNYTNEEGVRNLKRCFENIITKINLFYISNINTIKNDNSLPFKKNLLGNKNLIFPLEINYDIIKNLIENKNKKDIPYMMYS